MLLIHYGHLLSDLFGKTEQFLFVSCPIFWQQDEETGVVVPDRFKADAASPVGDNVPDNGEPKTAAG